LADYGIPGPHLNVRPRLAEDLSRHQGGESLFSALISRASATSTPKENDPRDGQASTWIYNPRWALLCNTPSTLLTEIYNS
jgi:hypothetical protein